MNAISINSPSNGQFFDYYSDISIDVSSSYGDIKIFVGNGTYDEDHNLICNFASSGSHQCNFTAYRGNSTIFDNCYSIYEFGDQGKALGDDTGIGNKDCSGGTALAVDNTGIRLDGGYFNNKGGLYCGDVRDSLFCSSCEFSFFVWGKSEDLSQASQSIFWKNDDRPKIMWRGGTLKDMIGSLWYTTVSPPISMASKDKVTENQWYWQSFQHDSTDHGYMYFNGIYSHATTNEDNPYQMYTSYSPGSTEYIGAESTSAFRFFAGTLDDLMICSGIYNQEDQEDMYKFKTGTYCVYVNDSNGDFDELCFNKDIDDPIVLNGADNRFFSSNLIPIDIAAQDDFNISLNVTLSNGQTICDINKNSSNQVCSKTVNLAYGDYVLRVNATDQSNRSTYKEYSIKIVPTMTMRLKSLIENITVSAWSNTKNVTLRLFK